MKISVIIPVYRVEKYIRRALRSVMLQTAQDDLEVLIVDDASPDGSMAIVNEMLDEYKGPILFRTLAHTSNKGLSVARNTGIREAAGDYLFFLDSDDELTPDCLEILSDTAKKYPGVDIVQGNLVVTDSQYRSLEITQYGFPEFSDDTDWIRYHFLCDIPVTVWNKLIRKDFILSNNLFFKEGLIHEDEHWKFLSYRSVGSIAFCSKPTYIYYLNQGSLSEARYKDRNFHSLLIIYREFLPMIENPRTYRRNLVQAVKLMKRLGELRDPQGFMNDFRDFICGQVNDPRVPKAAKTAMRWLLNPSKTLRTFCRIFNRPAYIYIKHFERS